MSNFTLSPANHSDLSGIASVSRAAFAENQHTMSYWMFPQDNEKAIFEWRLRGIVKTFESVPYCAYTKVVDGTIGNIVAFALWEAPHPPETEEEETKEKGDKDDHLPEGTNVRLLHDFDAETRVRTLATFSHVQFWNLVASHASKVRGIALCTRDLSSKSDFKNEEKMRDKHVDREKDYILRAIATLPEYQGRGCASLLLRSALEKINAEGAKTWLEATPQGQSLYAKFGWKVVDEIVFDLDKYGCGEWTQRTTVMERAKQI